jgi:hypothetical protein
MSDYRDPNDPMWRSTSYTADQRSYNATWGWIAGAVFLVIVLAIAFGVRNEPTHTASNDTAPSARMAPPPAINPASPANPSLTQRPAPTPAPTPGANPAPQGSQ